MPHCAHSLATHHCLVDASLPTVVFVSHARAAVRALVARLGVDGVVHEHQPVVDRAEDFIATLEAEFWSASAEPAVEQACPQKPRRQGLSDPSSSARCSRARPELERRPQNHDSRASQKAENDGDNDTDDEPSSCCIRRI